MGMLLCLAWVLSFVEGLIPALPSMPPGIKLGLSNIVTIYCLFFINAKSALFISILKSVFVFLTRGPIAGLLSLAGGVFSVIVMATLKRYKSFSYLLLSIFGAVSHNIGQIAVSALLFKTASIFYYLPLLIVSGVAMGTVTATLMKVLLPALKRISNDKKG